MAMVITMVRGSMIATGIMMKFDILRPAEISRSIWFAKKRISMMMIP
jgi:hypothetical protein